MTFNDKEIINLKNIIKHEQREYKERLESNRSESPNKNSSMYVGWEQTPIDILKNKDNFNI